MKITKTQLKEIIKEEASKIQKKTILENRKKDIIRELGTLSEGEKFDVDLTKINLNDPKGVASHFLDKAIDIGTLYAESYSRADGEGVELSTDLEARYINDNGEEVIFPLFVRASFKHWEDDDEYGGRSNLSAKEFYSVLECDDEFFEKHEDLHEIKFPLDDLVNSDSSDYLEDLAKSEFYDSSGGEDSFKSLGMSWSDFLEETKNVSKKKTILENKKKSSKSKLKLKKKTKTQLKENMEYKEALNKLSDIANKVGVSLSDLDQKTKDNYVQSVMNGIDVSNELIKTKYRLEPSQINESNKKGKMKITKTQLKEIIKEEVSRLKKQYILEDKKKAIIKEMRMLNENDWQAAQERHKDEEPNEWDYWVDKENGRLLDLDRSSLMHTDFYKTFIEPHVELKLIHDDEFKKLEDEGYVFVDNRNIIIDMYIK